MHFYATHIKCMSSGSPLLIDPAQNCTLPLASKHQKALNGSCCKLHFFLSSKNEEPLSLHHWASYVGMQSRYGILCFVCTSPLVPHSSWKAVCVHQCASPSIYTRTCSALYILFKHANCILGHWNLSFIV